MLDFLRTNVVPYLLAWGAIEALMYAARYVAFPPEVLTPLAGLAAVIYAPISATLIGSMLGNLQGLGLPGLPPDSGRPNRPLSICNADHGQQSFPQKLFPGPCNKWASPDTYKVERSTASRRDGREEGVRCDGGQPMVRAEISGRRSVSLGGNARNGPPAVRGVSRPIPVALGPCLRARAPPTPWAGFWVRVPCVIRKGVVVQ